MQLQMDTISLNLCLVSKRVSRQCLEQKNQTQTYSKANVINVFKCSCIWYIQHKKVSSVKPSLPDFSLELTFQKQCANLISNGCVSKLYILTFHSEITDYF